MFVPESAVCPRSALARLILRRLLEQMLSRFQQALKLMRCRMDSEGPISLSAEKESELMLDENLPGNQSQGWRGKVWWLNQQL